MTPQQLAAIDVARIKVEDARQLLEHSFAAFAAREAYLAGYHAALAYVTSVTGRTPRTHSGTRSEFARLTRGRMPDGLAGFLGSAYELKSSSDYGLVPDRAMTAALAADAVAQAAMLVAWVEAALQRGVEP